MSEYNPFDVGIPTAAKPEVKPEAKPVGPVEQPQSAPVADANSAAFDAPAAPISAAAFSAPAAPVSAAVSAPQMRYAAPPPPPAPAGRAPLAGQPAGMGAPMPQAMATAAPAMADPGVRYDLAGNPMPMSMPMGGPGAPPPMPEMGGGMQRFDLAGNPLPMHGSPAPQAPAAPYGYAPGPAAPPQYGGGGEYVPPQNAFRPSGPAGPMIPAGMEEAMTAGANWMIGIVILTLASIWINKLTYPFYMMPFISYAAVTGVIDIPWIFGHALGYNVAGVLGSLALIPLALLGALGFKRQAWVFVIAMVVYGFDIPVTILTWILNFNLWGIIFATAWHSFVFQRMFAAWTAAREINATMAGKRF